jgi:tetratricopeptide (TPR) repeat protein
MYPNVCTENHAARGCPDGLDFDIELPMGWQAETAAGALRPEGAMCLMWQAFSADTLARLQLRLQVSACLQPELPMGLASAAAQWRAAKGLLLNDAVGSTAPAVQRLAHCNSSNVVLGSARQGQGPEAPIVHFAYLRQGRHVLELLLHGPATRSEDALAAWRCAAASWRVHAAQPEGRQRHKQHRTPVSPAAWWLRAQALQAQGQLEEALNLVERECDQAGRLLAQAELLVRQMRQALAAGRLSEAMRAQERAVDCACSYAASATSGGEGAARSLQRDEFLRANGLPRYVEKA